MGHRVNIYPPWALPITLIGTVYCAANPKGDKESTMDDDMLLTAILAEDVGTIANIVQAASELTGTMSERLAKGYYELTNRDPGADTDTIGLR
jgi:hypothetical protein